MPSTTYQFGNLRIDLAARSLSRDGVTLAIQPRAFDLLAYLILHRDRAVGRDELISGVWGRIDISDSALAQAIRMARKSIGDSGDRQQSIRTLFGFGYQWVVVPDGADVRARVSDQASEALIEAPLPPLTPLTRQSLANTVLGNRALRKALLAALFALATCGGFAVADALSAIAGRLQDGHHDPAASP